MESIGLTVTTVVVNALTKLGNYLPQFLGGLVILVVGLVVAALLKEVVLRFFQYVGVESWVTSVQDWFNKLRTEKAVRGRVWPNILAELVRWTVVILFLVPAVEAWGLPKVTDLLNQFLLYVPNVFVAVIAGFLGLVIANLLSEIVRSASRGLGSDSANLLATVARYAVIFFTVLVVLNQLGVAADLVRILFTGIVAMLALAGGLAFGLGGQANAQRALEDLRRRATTAPAAELRVAARESRVAVRTRGRVKAKGKRK